MTLTMMIGFFSTAEGDSPTAQGSLQQLPGQQGNFHIMQGIMKQRQDHVVILGGMGSITTDRFHG